MTLLNVASSSIFITNAAAGFLKKNILYAALFVMLTLTSWYVHGVGQNKIMVIADKIAILAVVLYGAYQLYLKNNYASFYFIVAFITFSISGYMFYYGQCSSSFCFHPQFGNEYHALLHVASSIGHHAIMAL